MIRRIVFWKHTKSMILGFKLTTRRAPFWETPKFQKTGPGGPEVCVGIVELESDWKHVLGA